MSDPAISVLMPVRDAAPTLDRAVASVLASRERGFELVCVDDGSRDKSPAILKGWSERDDRVRVIRSPPLGIVAALQRGLGEAGGALVARMDADDEMHPERLSAQAARMAAEPDLALLGCGVESFREGGLQNGYRIYSDWVNGLVTPEQIAREAFVECPVPHPTWMFRSDVVRALGGYRDRPWPEDLDLLYRLLESGARVAKVARLLHRWRDHDGRLSRVDARYRREAFAAAKAHFVGRIHPMRAAVVWGAGRTGRRMVGLLANEGIETRVLIDIRPDRIGGRWRGIPIVSPAVVRERALHWRADGMRVLGAVASRGARDEIRAQLVDAGLREGNDFLMVA